MDYTSIVEESLKKADVLLDEQKEKLLRSLSGAQKKMQKLTAKRKKLQNEISSIEEEIAETVVKQSQIRAGMLDVMGMIEEIGYEEKRVTALLELVDVE